MTIEQLGPMRDYAVAWIGCAVEKHNAPDARNAELAAQADAAEWSAHTANLALAQAALDADDYPEARRRLAECPEGKRGWEWRFLTLRAPSTVAVLGGDRPEFSPDGTRIGGGDDRG